MALNNFSNANFVFSLNGRVISDWGEAANPCNEEPMNPKATMRKGQGGNAVALDHPNPGRRVTLSLNPGGNDSAYVQGLFNSNAVVTCSKQQIGTLEAAVGTEGRIVNDGPVGRGGATNVTDDVYIIEFNTWSGSKGG